ncbi:hypothetical protein PPROV_000106400 [Pycnococcus provasolii]|uniref:tRNA pseudouridine(55) synthase n=1 Tax=Pycnococcus provasolii TaxID=41880 RepID=A0A830HB52_9CHLO|nr:hypothetical protein PPROV_000106400 [Pycnococcus provasolii]
MAAENTAPSPSHSPSASPSACSSCLLRLQSITDFAQYFCTASHSLTATPATPPCPLCLGILTPTPRTKDWPACAYQASQLALREEYDYKLFQSLVVRLEVDAKIPDQEKDGLSLRTVVHGVVIEGLRRTLEDYNVDVRPDLASNESALRLYARIVDDDNDDSNDNPEPSTSNRNPHAPPPPKRRDFRGRNNKNSKKNTATPNALKLACRFVAPSLYVAGRYVKEMRSLAQSPWFDLELNERVGDGSVQEVLYDALRRSGALPSSERCKLISAGREDLDVRMLGEGRPFVIEAVNPTTPSVNAEMLPVATRDLEEGDYGAYARGLRVCSSQGTSLRQLQAGESQKTKFYEALCYSLSPLTDEEVQRLTWSEGVTIAQATPLRVLHRRSSIVRERCVLSCRPEVVAGTHGRAFVLHLSTTAGTYVKELVHGDLGRTVPSICSLLGRGCWCLQLDVTCVDMPFDGTDDETHDGVPGNFVVDIDDDGGGGVGDDSDNDKAQNV